MPFLSLDYFQILGAIVGGPTVLVVNEFFLLELVS